MGNLARNTLNGYAASWNSHVLARLGGYRLRDLSPQVIVGSPADANDSVLLPVATINPATGRPLNAGPSLWLWLPAVGIPTLAAAVWLWRRKVQPAH